MLDAKLKKKWVAALRSGEYAQIQGYLKDRVEDENGDPTEEIGFCCLGVLREISGGTIRKAPEEEVLTTSAIDREIQNKLVQMNDGIDAEGDSCPSKSFKQIATWIERNKDI